VLSTVLLVTAFASLIGVAINVLVMLVLLSRGRRKHHILFALLLLIAACWDLGIFLITIRNDFPEEILMYQNIISIPFNLFPAFIYHFTTIYLNQPRRISTIAIYVYSITSLISVLTGAIRPYTGVYNYSWGNIARARWDLSTISWLVVYHFSILFSCWLLFQARKLESSPLKRRHMGYIMVSFIVFSVAYVKVLLTYGFDIPFILPLGMLLVDSFGAVIGLAIVKEQLFDITVLVRRGVIYSVLTALIVFLFDFTQHLAATFFEGLVGGHSEVTHYISIAVVIIAFMPIKQRLEHTIGAVFEKKKIEF
jgi:hypothetical protein